MLKVKVINGCLSINILANKTLYRVQPKYYNADNVLAYLISGHWLQSRHLKEYFKLLSWSQNATSSSFST